MLRKSSFWVESITSANFKSKTSPRKGREPSFPKKKLKIQLLNTLPYFTVLCLQRVWAQTERSRPFNKTLYIFIRNLFTQTYFCAICGADWSLWGLLSMLPPLAFMPHTLLARSLWISTPCPGYGFSGRGKAGNISSREAGQDSHPVRNSLCPFHLPHMPFPTIGKEM